MLDPLTLAIEAAFDSCDWFDNSSGNFLSDSQAELNCPDMLALDVSVLEAEACT